MEQPPHPIDASVNTILPVLKMFPTNEIAIIGCHALNLSRRSCEYDLLIVNRDPIPEKFIKVGEVYARIIFRNERDVKQPDPQLALTLASAVPLRDTSLLLAGATSDCKRSFSVNCRKSMETRLAASLKSLARSEELLSQKETQEADLLSSRRRGTLPTPSCSRTVRSLPRATSWGRSRGSRSGGRPASSSGRMPAGWSSRPASPVRTGSRPFL